MQKGNEQGAQVAEIIEDGVAKQVFDEDKLLARIEEEQFAKENSKQAT